MTHCFPLSEEKSPNFNPNPRFLRILAMGAKFRDLKFEIGGKGMEPFTFEKLGVYQKAIRWVETVDGLCQKATGHVSNNTLDQLSRAALSIP